MTELTQEFNPKEPFGEIHGNPNYRYEQNGVLFDASKNPIALNPQGSVKPKKVDKPASTKPVSTKSVTMKAGMAIPDVQAEVQKENLAAKSAERWAD